MQVSVCLYDSCVYMSRAPRGGARHEHVRMWRCSTCGENEFPATIIRTILELNDMSYSVGRYGCVDVYGLVYDPPFESDKTIPREFVRLELQPKPDHDLNANPRLGDDQLNVAPGRRQDDHRESRQGASTAACLTCLRCPGRMLEEDTCRFLLSLFV